MIVDSFASGFLPSCDLTFTFQQLVAPTTKFQQLLLFLSATAASNSSSIHQHSLCFYSSSTTSIFRYCTSSIEIIFVFLFFDF
ncbi:hypothetical protein F511_19812 [Dorcoceras hygrometricum]|uniref:Uncharacterized protein n=1 Tax=Dorcoceras hygrometricum TaxID=472368 RepID=A0A2Z7AQ48_9LAMI|nr:hypothetical protein F511_19812 [Dorcoceras hygrometricum]